MLHIVTNIIFILLYIAAIILIIKETRKIQVGRWFIIFPILILVQETVYSALWVTMQTIRLSGGESHIVLTLLDCIAFIDKFKFPIIFISLAFCLIFLIINRRAKQ